MSGVGKRIAALKSFNVCAYLVGSSLSYIGTFTQSFAQYRPVLTISGNRTALPITIGLQADPLLLFGTWGGTIVDRFDNRRLLGITTLLNTMAAVALGVVVAAGDATVGLVYLFSLLSGILLVFERPALQAILTELAQPDEIPSAVGLNAMVQPLSRLVGPPLASLIIAVRGIAACCYINGASYLLFLASLAVLRVSEARLSVPMACSAIGSLIGGMSVTGMKTPTVRLLGLAAAVFGVVLAAYGGAPNYAAWVAVAFPIGFISAVFTTMVIQLLQQSTRPEMLGRVMSLYSIAFLGTTPIGAIMVAWLASGFSARPVPGRRTRRHRHRRRHGPPGDPAPRLRVARRRLHAARQRRTVVGRRRCKQCVRARARVTDRPCPACARPSMRWPPTWLLSRTMWRLITLLRWAAESATRSRVRG